MPISLVTPVLFLIMQAGAGNRTAGALKGLELSGPNIPFSGPMIFRAYVCGDHG
jgi:hypothetical protein